MRLSASSILAYSLFSEKIFGLPLYAAKIFGARLDIKNLGGVGRRRLRAVGERVGVWPGSGRARPPAAVVVSVYYLHHRFNYALKYPFTHSYRAQR